MHPLFDAHCHLQAASLQAGLPQVLARAQEAGIERLLCCGVREQDWPLVRALAERYPQIIPAYGLHPYYVLERSPHWRDLLREYLGQHPAGVGEIGLDRLWPAGSASVQEEVLLAQLQLAQELQRPVIIHCRQAWGRLLALLQAVGRLPAGGMLHAYSGSPELLGLLEKMGFYFSFGGAVIRPGNRRAAQGLLRVSLNRLLLETDSPSLTSRGAPGAINEPAQLTLVAAAAARIRGLELEGLVAQTYANACRLLGPIIGST